MLKIHVLMILVQHLVFFPTEYVFCVSIVNRLYDGAAVDSSSSLSRNRRFIIVNGDGVPEYPEIDNDGIDNHDIDYDLDDIDDVDDPDDGYYGPGHHFWWHHVYHHDSPILPFPLFPPFPRRYPKILVPRCDQWPFTCHNRLEVIQWLQCYYEYIGGPHHDVYSGHGTSVHFL
ncbi:uncharacterized protein LOC126904414 [Daktulosphaira vitifoliae]|uniref:uncharacterized protein LOC126904414 n=1 Tax=Daktulosphaira vitifoliae TaxID=58002 RepID=UPI0021AA144C|nr:uncharacterized protein LOC126904414 [Daktulosphaira vitifoliae]